MNTVSTIAIRQHNQPVSLALALLVMLVLALASGGAKAQSTELLPEGQTLIRLSVSETRSVEQDLLVAQLRVEKEDRDATVLQNAINQMMTAALDQVDAAAISDLDVETGYYSVYQTNRQPQGGRADQVWRGTQSLTLQSKSAADILALVGELQGAGLILGNLSYQVSDELARDVRDSLLETALNSARMQAERIAEALGKDEVDIAVVDLDDISRGGQPRSMMMRAASAADMEMAPPAARAGESEVSLTVRVQAVAK
ncbi:SIMPL domain-containing protein [Pseudohongiella nitratireducens]|uniref:SIMPL domain-containing protein n=1 Tax=Pseudohongiella nitratireducens TaxID=1768907 RepID=UPI0030EF5B92|tara:strand:- start:86 stop:856 length:771 start_codon:yes stop_codon:yes gene_type:complete